MRPVPFRRMSSWSRTQMRKSIALALFLCASVASAQWNTPHILKSQLPACVGGAHAGKAFAVRDAIAADDCTVGGASIDDAIESICFCTWDGYVAVMGTGGSTDPGGSDTQVQYNDGGAFGGDSGLTFNETTNALTAGSFLVSGVARGDASGPASSTDNAIARFDLATGKLLQNSTLFISDTGILGFTGLTSSDIGLSDAGGTLNVRLADDSGWSQARSKGYELYATSNTSQRVLYMFAESPFQEIAMSSGFWVNWASSSTAAGSGDVGISREAASGLRITGGTKASTVGWVLSSLLVEANTAGSGTPNVLTAIESGTALTNEDTSAENYHTLPSAVAGLRFTFTVQDTDGIRIVAAAGDTIRPGAVAASATAGFIRCATQGASITLLAINATEWVATSVIGTWTVDA